MSKLKLHLKYYNKKQRIGILILLFLIISVQIIYYYINTSSDKITTTNSEDINTFQKQIDSLKAIQQKEKNKIYPFNPNYITDFKGYQLGMTVAEIDRLHQYRNSGKWVNSAKEFQKVTKISDSLLLKLAPYFKFPNFVKTITNKVTHQTPQKKLIKLTTTDLNKATANDFKTIKGIGEVLSQRIIKYRTKLQGFTFKNQLYEVWGLEKEVADLALQTFKIIEKPTIKKININTASFKEVLHLPYIDYNLCKKIFNYRDEVAELQNINELKNINGFPLDKYEKIVLYLEAQ